MSDPLQNIMCSFRQDSHKLNMWSLRTSIQTDRQTYIHKTRHIPPKTNGSSFHQVTWILGKQFICDLANKHRRTDIQTNRQTHTERQIDRYAERHRYPGRQTYTPPITTPPKPAAAEDDKCWTRQGTEQGTTVRKKTRIGQPLSYLQSSEELHKWGGGKGV